MNALTRPTVFSRDEASDIQSYLDHAIGELLKLRAAYDNAFVYQTPDGERFASKDLLQVSRDASEAHDQMQIALMSRIASHLGEPTETFALRDIRAGNMVLDDVRTEYAERIEDTAPAEADYRPSNTDHLLVVNGRLV